MASPECYPFAKVGGLGDMVGSLSKVLARQGHDIRVCLPLYGCVQTHDYWSKHDNITIQLGNHSRTCSIWETALDNVTYYFIEYDAYFGNKTIYCDPDERYIFFCCAILDMCQIFRWFPDVIHCHDWTTGSIPVYLKTTKKKGKLQSIATVFTIHNIANQGPCSPDILTYAGIPFTEFHAHSLEARGYVNFLKGALYCATKLTAVSPRYAQEIQTPAFGEGLDDVLRFRAADLIGILNGIDEIDWDPATDPAIAANYSHENLAPKAKCKQALQKQFRLPENHSLLIGVVSRLCHQKGLDIFMDILPFVFRDMSIQVIFVGHGELKLECRLKKLEQQFPERLRAFIGYKSDLAHQTQAGCDIFLMPSRFEPCGLTQFYAMRYGTLPIVRATGGLIDTVENLDEEKQIGCGFVFSDLCNDALYNTIAWAYSVYLKKPQLFQKMQRTAMQKDFSWKHSVIQYEAVYQSAIKKHNVN